MSQFPSADRTSRRRLVSLFVGGVVAAGLGLGVTAGTAAAKEIGSGGGGGGGTTVCNPVNNLSYRGDARVGETGLASIDVSYSVKPCDPAQTVTVTTHVARLSDATNIVWDDPAAPLSGKFTVFGVATRTSYLVTVTVFDGATGAVAGTRSITAAAIPKGV